MNINDIKDIVRGVLNENSTYDKILSLDNWYKEERDKIDKNFDGTKDYKTWKLKTKQLQKQYFDKKNPLVNKDNSYALKGNMGATSIYHYTDGNALISIIEDNMMIGSGDYGGISFTSHPNLYKRGFVFWYPNQYSKGKHHGNIGVKIKFDFNQMKNDGLKFKRGSENIGTHAGEEELFLGKDELHNPMKYVREIIIFKDKESEYLSLSKFLDDKNIKYKIV